jgi:hypothetical protein
MRNFVLVLCLLGCAPKPTTSGGVPYAGKYALNWPVLTSDTCGGGCQGRAYWSQTPMWSVNLGAAAYSVDVASGAVDAEVAGDALNFAIESPVSTPDCSGDAVYMVTLAPQSNGCNVDMQARFAVRCHGITHVCACSYTMTGTRMP